MGEVLAFCPNITINTVELSVDHASSADQDSEDKEEKELENTPTETLNTLYCHSKRRGPSHHQHKISHKRCFVSWHCFKFGALF